MEVSESTRQLVEGIKRSQAAFVAPLPEPCNHIDCLTYNEFGQCPDCGWLKPHRGDHSSWDNAMREAPMGTGGVSMLGLSKVDAAFVREQLG